MRRLQIVNINHNFFNQNACRFPKWNAIFPSPTDPFSRCHFLIQTRTKRCSGMTAIDIINRISFMMNLNPSIVDLRISGTVCQT